MKKILIKYTLTILSASLLFLGCKEDDRFKGNVASSYIANFDLKKLHKGADVPLTTDVMNGASYVRGHVISDHAGKNLPEGLLILQNSRTVGNGIDSLRGMAINIGADAANYKPGDSVQVYIVGGVLKRNEDMLQITGKAASDVTKISSGNPVVVTRGFANLILAQPERFENMLITMVKSTFNPLLTAASVMAGEKIINDGSSDLILKTQQTATFADLPAPFAANYTGIMFIKKENEKIIPQHRLRTLQDIKQLNINVEDAPPFVITGWLNSPSPAAPATSTPTNYEYIQFRATKDIDFSVTNFSVVTSNNAGATVPTGFPNNGWATAGSRTYKFDLVTGNVSKGEFFYVGSSNKLINGPESTSIADSKWILSKAYNTASAPFNPGSTPLIRGNSVTNLLANSGNSYGIAVFKGLVVNSQSIPADVVFVHNGGSIYQAGVAPTYGVGYRIGNTDLYDVVNPVTDANQPYFMSGTNTQRFVYQPNASNAELGHGYFYVLGGVFDSNQRKWIEARSTPSANQYIRLTATSTIDEIEGNDKTTRIK